MIFLESFSQYLQLYLQSVQLDHFQPLFRVKVSAQEHHYFQFLLEYLERLHHIQHLRLKGANANNVASTANRYFFITFLSACLIFKNIIVLFILRVNWATSITVKQRRVSGPSKHRYWRF